MLTGTGKRSLLVRCTWEKQIILLLAITVNFTEVMCGRIICLLQFHVDHLPDLDVHLQHGHLRDDLPNIEGEKSGDGEYHDSEIFSDYQKSK